MTSKTLQFNDQNRGCSRTLVLIPGWATDVRLFEPLLLPYNYILPCNVTPETFALDLHRWLDENHHQRVSLLGWSMGGFLAADFARQFPSQVDELFLLSVRQTFDPRGLDAIRQLLHKDRRVYLYGFYTQCFRHCPPDHLARFKRSLLKPYLESMTTEDLLRGLDYLAGAQIDASALADLPGVHFFHGRRDEITPIAEARALAAQIPNATFRTFPDLGHILFYDATFLEALHG